MSCIVKDASMAVFCIDCFTKVLETKPLSSFLELSLKSGGEGARHCCNNINVESGGRQWFTLGGSWSFLSMQGSVTCGRK